MPGFVTVNCCICKDSGKIETFAFSGKIETAQCHVCGGTGHVVVITDSDNNAVPCVECDGTGRRMVKVKSPTSRNPFITRSCPGCGGCGYAGRQSG